MNQTAPAIAAMLFLQALAPCQGLFVPDQPPQEPRGLQHDHRVESSLLQVKVTMMDGACTTDLTQTLQNRTGTQQEAWWMLPLPRGASADRFSMTVGGVETESEVLDATKARSIYERIVRQRRDPGLLEYLGTGMLRARVFPIPPHGEILVKVRYTELLRPSGGITTYRFPLRAAWCDGHGPKKLGFAVEVRSTVAIKTVWSPLQSLDITQKTDHLTVASLELSRDGLPPRDLTLHYGTTDQDFGANVLTWRRAGEAGYFLALLAPKRDWAQQESLRRSINLVLDTSGSMKGEKIVQARAAVRSFLQSLGPDDFFNVIPFSTDARPFFDEPKVASKENVDEALTRITALQARGGTNIEDALSFALSCATPNSYERKDGHPQLVPMTVFLTDGLPTVGTTDINALLKTAQAKNTNKARVFVFGVGHDVNTRLLDTLAAETRGDRDYVQPGEDIEIKTSALFAKLSGPVMTNVTFSIDGIQAERVEPRSLPDMFVQGQLAIVGRFQGNGQHALHLRGTVGDQKHEYVFEASFPKAASENDWLPTLWAQRRVAGLLDAIRLNGNQPELIAEVKRLGREHGLVTPYTSHLVVEEGTRIAEHRGVPFGTSSTSDPATADRLRRDWRAAGTPQPTGPGTAGPASGFAAQAQREAERAATGIANDAEVGDEAVAKSQMLKMLASSTTLEVHGVTALLSRRIAGRVFHLAGGVWVDSRYDKKLESSIRKVIAYSDEYFELLRARPRLTPFLAFSERIVILDGPQVIEIVPL